MKSKLTKKEADSFMNSIVDKPSLMDKIKDKISFAFHKHHYVPTGRESYKSLSEWHVQKVKEVECDICGKKSNEYISFMRV